VQSVTALTANIWTASFVLNAIFVYLLHAAAFVALTGGEVRGEVKGRKRFEPGVQLHNNIYFTMYSVIQIQKGNI